MDAVKHYQKTGQHKQVSIQYNPANRTQFEFDSWKHDKDSQSVRKILPEDIKISSQVSSMLSVKIIDTT